MNYFELFDLPAQFELSVPALKSKYLQLLQHYHPDQVVNESNAVQRHAVQMSTAINDGYQVLSRPVTRALHLMQEVQGVVVDLNQTVSDMDLLMQQMTWREALEDFEAQGATALSALWSFLEEIQGSQRRYEQQLASACAAKNWSEAGSWVQWLQFIEKLIAEIEALEAKWTGT